MHAFITRKADSAFVVLRVEDNEKTAQYLKSCGVKIVEADGNICVIDQLRVEIYINTSLEAI